MYKTIADSVANGTWKPNQKLNWGLQENCVGLSPWCVNVPGSVVNQVETIKMNWVNDKMDKWCPFSAGVTKQDGTKIPAGEIKRHALDTMNFYVEGVNGKLQ